MTGYAVVFAPIAAIPASSRKSAQESVSHETEQALMFVRIVRDAKTVTL